MRVLPCSRHSHPPPVEPRNQTNPLPACSVEETPPNASAIPREAMDRKDARSTSCRHHTPATPPRQSCVISRLQPLVNADQLDQVATPPSNPTAFQPMPLPRLTRAPHPNRRQIEPFEYQDPRSTPTHHYSPWMAQRPDRGLSGTAVWHTRCLPPRMQARPLSWIVMCACLWATLTARANAQTVPLQFQDGLLWVEVQAHNSPRPLHFLIDSGASISVLLRCTADRLGLKLGPQATVTGVGTTTGVGPTPWAAQIGPIDLPNEVLVLDLDRLAKVCGRPRKCRFRVVPREVVGQFGVVHESGLPQNKLPPPLSPGTEKISLTRPTPGTPTDPGFAPSEARSPCPSACSTPPSVGAPQSRT